MINLLALAPNNQQNKESVTNKEFYCTFDKLKLIKSFFAILCKLFMQSVKRIGELYQCCNIIHFQPIIVIDLSSRDSLSINYNFLT